MPKAEQEPGLLCHAMLWNTVAQTTCKQGALCVKALNMEMLPAYLHVSLQLQQVEPVPREESWPFVGEVHFAEAFLACPKESLFD